MRIAIHHPYFLPWLGYFSKLEFADALVILDTAAFRRNHIKRVQIFDNRNEVCWLCVPVGNNRGVPCNSICLPPDTRYVADMLKLLLFSYKRAQSFEAEYEFFSELLRDKLCSQETLMLANIDIFVALRSHMKLTPKPILLASSLTAELGRTERIIEICEALNASELLIGDGQMSAVHDLDRLRQRSIKIARQAFFQAHPVYQQLHTARTGKAFVPGLSVLDALLNIGAESTASLIRARHLAPIVY